MQSNVNNGVTTKHTHKKKKTHLSIKLYHVKNDHGHIAKSYINW